MPQLARCGQAIGTRGTLPSVVAATFGDFVFLATRESVDEISREARRN